MNNQVGLGWHGHGIYLFEHDGAGNRMLLDASFGAGASRLKHSSSGSDFGYGQILTAKEYIMLEERMFTLPIFLCVAGVF